jgi:hypothetical protein
MEWLLHLGVELLVRCSCKYDYDFADDEYDDIQAQLEQPTTNLKCFSHGGAPPLSQTPP